MIKKFVTDRIIENYEYYICTGEGRRYEFKWRSKIAPYYTCGQQGIEIECMEIIPESLEIVPFSSAEGMATQLTLSKFNDLHPDEQLDLNCNSHGFAFANGKFTIANDWVDKILEEEFYEVTPDEVALQNYDMIIFRNESGVPIHSCKFQYDLFMHKEGIRKFTIHRTVEEIISIAEYRNARMSYYRRKSRSCPGICMNAVGEVNAPALGKIQIKKY